MKPSELFSLLDQLKVYSNCDELRVTYDGNIMAFWFYWMNKDFNVMLEFREDKIQPFPNNDKLIDVLIEIVNQAKREWSIRYGKPFEEPSDLQDGLDLGDLAV